jgi:hypothetical protein
VSDSSINLEEKLSRVAEHWRPKIICELNDYEVKLVGHRSDGGPISQALHVKRLEDYECLTEVNKLGHGHGEALPPRQPRSAST